MENNYAKMSMEYFEVADQLEKRIRTLRKTAQNVKWTHKENDKLAKRIALLNDMYIDCRVAGIHLRQRGTHS